MKRFTLLLYFCFFIATAGVAQKSYVEQRYTKRSVYIPMRDGVKLFTTIYFPKDKSTKYPFLLKRTCYGTGPYSATSFPTSLGPSKFLMESNYIFVYQDVRGRYKSEGEFVNMRPNIPGNNRNKKEWIDESSDTFDTIDWLLKNIEGHNGRVGQWGISYPGFYTAAALPDAHPALKASSPQAPISDFFFDDFHHMGAFLQSYLMAIPVFGVQKEGEQEQAWYTNEWDSLKTLKHQNDAYAFHRALGGTKNIDAFYGEDEFWNDIRNHPNYDSYWQKRNILPHLKGVKHAVLTVGGWLDAEDLYGPLNIYKTLEKNNAKMQNSIVMGPWSHGDWYREKGSQYVNHIYFGDSISTFYQKNIELPFFEYHLKNKGILQLPEAFMFDTGLKEWVSYSTWPPQNTAPIALKFEKGGKLIVNNSVDTKATFSYVSDPHNPVPNRSEIVPVGFTPRAFMTDDQRHAATRPDVLTFQTDILEEDFTFSGAIKAKLEVMLSTSDADFVVKIIDVYPDDYAAANNKHKHVNFGGYQQLVRSEVFRGRFRNSFSDPEPFVPNTVEKVNIVLQDVLHTFKKGHKIMVQIHSTWFPYIDRNPQQYVENMYNTSEKDFVVSTITVLGSSEIVIGENKSLETSIDQLKE